MTLEIFLNLTVVIFSISVLIYVVWRERKWKDKIKNHQNPLTYNKGGNHE